MTSAECEERLRAIPGVTALAQHPDGLWAEGDALDVEAMAEAMNAAGIRLATISGIPLAEYGETQIIYHFIGADGTISFRTASRNGRLPSIATAVRAAAWAEREINDLFAVDFPGHPDMRPLLRPPGFAEGMFRAAMNRQARGAKTVTAE